MARGSRKGAKWVTWLTHKTAYADKVGDDSEFGYNWNFVNLPTQAVLGQHLHDMFAFVFASVLKKLKAMFLSIRN